MAQQLTIDDLDQIETIIRNQGCRGEDPFESWLDVDQDQALQVLALAKAGFVQQHRYTYIK